MRVTCDYHLEELMTKFGESADLKVVDSIPELTLLGVRDEVSRVLLATQLTPQEWAQVFSHSVLGTYYRTKWREEPITTEWIVPQLEQAATALCGARGLLFPMVVQRIASARPLQEARLNKLLHTVRNYRVQEQAYVASFPRYS